MLDDGLRSRVPGAGLPVASIDWLVIGAGFIGKAVARELVERGAGVTLASRSPVAPPDESLAGVRYVHVGPSNIDTLATLMRPRQRVVVAVGASTPAAADRDPAAGLRSELEVLALVLRAAQDVEGSVVSYLSSGGTVYGDAALIPTPEDAETHPIGSYGMAKLAGEELLRVSYEDFGQRARILRIANVYGPGQPSSGGQGVVGSAFRAATSGEPLRLVDGGRAVRDFVFVSDVASAIVQTAALEEALGVYNVGSGRGASIAEVVACVERCTGRPIATIDTPRRPFDVARSLLDISALRAAITYEPTSLEDGLKATWSALIA